MRKEYTSSPPVPSHHEKREFLGFVFVLCGWFATKWGKHPTHSASNETGQTHLEQLVSYGFCIRPNYVSSRLIDELRSDVLTLQSNRQFTVSQIGDDPT
mmetsp:Transcript_64575/g.75761  ORF Transcript_64575/g.75761 Transcript_64575/m.75761 type:complete len:99 (-) Transcript_64575:3-299(-)